jgi:hypothetical protein
MHPVLGREVIEREQLVQVVGDLGDRLSYFDLKKRRRC